MAGLKNILITGGAGFIGSHAVDKLIEKGFNVVVVDNLSSGKIENINKNAKFIKEDIRNPEISKILKKESIDAVFHFAAQPIVEKAYNNPLETIDINVMGTANILEACRQNKNLKSVIIISSDKAYGKSEKLPYKEDFNLKGDHPYDFSKTAADLLAQTYFKTYNLPVTVVRFSNVFGPRDFNFGRIIPDIFKSVLTKQPLLLRSDGKMVREYTYVKDIADGCCSLLCCYEKVKGEAFNFGSKNIFNVLDLIKKTEQILQTKVDYKILNIAENEIPEQYLDWSKSERILDWQPKISFEEGIKQTFNWYKSTLK